VHGRQPYRRKRLAAALLLAMVLGCGDDAPQALDQPPGPCTEAATLFNPSAAGTIRGQVIWTGDPARVPPFDHRLNVLAHDPIRQGPLRQNPNAPAIDPVCRGVGNAVVYLRGVAVRRARPWDHPRVVVEQRDYRFCIRQGDAESSTGFVRRGQPVEMVSRQPVFHALRARGAAFFTLAFPDSDQPCSRMLDRAGVVELTSGAGYFWMRAYLFVDDHPYYTRTDTQGRYKLPQVPPGRYDVLCWLPSWRVERQERDPETGLVTRLHFHQPAVLVRPVTLEAGRTQDVRFAVSATVFP
jgi:hypothetical protein